MRDVVLLGSTGSIGTQALEVVTEHPGQFRVVGLAAGGSSIALLAQQVLDTGARTVGLSKSDERARPSARALRRSEQARLGERGPAAAADPGRTGRGDLVARLPCDVVLNGITGSSGLAPTLAALEAGSILALANKESLVIGGPLVTSAAAEGQIVAVDSEHSALAQCLRGAAAAEVDRLILTASGGPSAGVLGTR